VLGIVLTTLGCAKPSPPAADVIVTATSPGPTPTPIPIPSPIPTQSQTPIPIRFRITDQLFREDPTTHRETYFVTLDVLADTAPPQRIAKVTLHEPGCRLALDAEELESRSGRIVGGLVCHYAGYGDYVVVADHGGGKLVVTSYGESEPTTQNLHPKRDRERTLGTIAIPRDARPILELVDDDGDAGGILP
jgi:hypothetical protein